MTFTLVLPGACLLLVMIGGLLALRLDARAQRLRRRVEAVGMPEVAALAAEVESRRSIRIAPPGASPVRTALRRALRIPLDPPAGQGVPAPLLACAAVLPGLAAAALARLYFSPAVAVVAGVVCGVLAVRSIFKGKAERYADRLRTQMPDMIEQLASAIRAGLPVSEAFRGIAREMPAPTRDEFTRVSREVALGTPADEALIALYRRTLVSEYAIFAVTLGVQSRSGGRLSETIQMLADTIRQRIALAARASALAAEAKLSATILTVLPFLGAGMMAFTQPGALDPLLHDKRGQHMLFIGFTLLLLGQFTMRRMIASATRE